MSETIDLREWMVYFREATSEVASSALKFEGPRPAPRGKGAPMDVGDNKPRPGGFISLLSDSAALRLGITATLEGCRTLARSLLGLHPTQPVSDREVGDAVSELMNIIAGRVKSRVSERDASIQLGLPMFIESRVQETGSMERQAADIQLGPVDCTLLVYRSKRAA
jgi:hypothetical protein